MKDLERFLLRRMIEKQAEYNLLKQAEEEMIKRAFLFGLLRTLGSSYLNILRDIIAWMPITITIHRPRKNIFSMYADIYKNMANQFKKYKY